MVRVYCMLIRNGLRTLEFVKTNFPHIGEEVEKALAEGLYL